MGEGRGLASAPSPIMKPRSCSLLLTISNFWSLLFLKLEMKGLDQMFAKVLSALAGKIWECGHLIVVFQELCPSYTQISGAHRQQAFGEICLWAWTVAHSPPGRPNETLSTNETSHLGSHLETRPSLFWGKAM